MSDPSLVNPSGPVAWLVGTIITPVVVVVMLVIGKLATGRERDRLEAEVARLNALLAERDAQIAAVQEKFTERVIPALVKATTALEAVAPYLQTETVVRRDKS